MITKYVETYMGLSQDSALWQDVSKTPPRPIVVDESALSQSQAHIETKRAELSELQERRAALEAQIAQAQAEYKRVSVLAELGEVSEAEAKRNAKELATLDAQLRELTESTNTILGTIAVKEGALELLRIRKKEAVLKERERLYKQLSDETRAELQTLVDKAAELNEIALSVGKRFRELSASELADVRSWAAPNFENIVHAHFHQMEHELHGNRTTEPYINEKERKYGKEVPV